MFDGFESLDVFGPVEVLARDPAHTLRWYALHGGTVHSAQGAAIAALPLCLLPPDTVLLVPGGRGTRRLVADDGFLSALRTAAEAAHSVLSVCTGSALLAAAGLLDGRRATSNKRAFDWACAQGRAVQWQRSARWVRDGRLYTSSGVSAGIDMALGFLADLYGNAHARATAAAIEYLWNDDPDRDPFAV